MGKAATPNANATIQQIDDSEIIGLDHPLADKTLVMKVLPHGVRVPLAELHRASYLLTHPLEFGQVPPNQTIALVAVLESAMDREFRDAQALNLKQTGKARP